MSLAAKFCTLSLRSHCLSLVSSRLREVAIELVRFIQLVLAFSHELWMALKVSPTFSIDSSINFFLICAVTVSTPHS